MGPKVQTSGNGKEKINWSGSETEFLVDEFILRKDVILGSFSASITKEKKHKAWEEIAANLNLEFPDSVPKDKIHVKKKWENLMREARNEIQKYNSSIRGTGGGPHFSMKPINIKIHEKVIGKDNPAITSIEGGLDTDNPDSVSPQSLFDFAEDNSRLPFDIPENTTLQIIVRDQSMENVTGEIIAFNPLPGTSSTPAQTPAQTPCVMARKNNKLTLRQRENASKRKACEQNDVAVEKRVLRERIKLLHAAFEFRLLSGNPMTLDEYPEDLREILDNPSTI